MAITAEEMFDRVAEMLDLADERPSLAYRVMHEVLVLTCHVGVNDTRQAFGNLFSQVDFVCKRLHINTSDRIIIQRMRRHSNTSQPLPYDDLRQDAHALCLFIAAVFGTSIPSRIKRRLPSTNQPHTTATRQPSTEVQPTQRHIRCIIRAWDDTTITAVTESDDSGEDLHINYTDFPYLKDILKEGMQLNLLNAISSSTPSGKEDTTNTQPSLPKGTTVIPRLIIVEPDFLIDISSIAACFEEYGRHPWSYIVKRMEPREISQPILLGNFAGSMLDDIINNERANVNKTICNNFKEKALEFCACNGFDTQQFLTDAHSQAKNMQEAVEVLFNQNAFDREKAILEPSFVCERLGIQGRVDLMTTDMRLLVEQKSGKNFNIESGRPNAKGSFQLEQHYVQLLLYYGVLRYNFDLSADRVDIRLLYSKYPAARGLVVVAFYRQLFLDAIAFRNRLVAEELRIADEGFDNVIDRLTTETLNENHLNTPFFNRWKRPQLDRITLPLQRLSPLERAYYARMMTFVYREQRVSKLGDQQGHGHSGSDLWNMPLDKKQSTGNIYLNLTLTKKEKSSSYNGFDTLTLHVPDQGEDFLPNFRRGDMVYLYSYHDEEKPDVRHSILYKGVLQSIRSDELTVHMNDGQQNASALIPGTRPFYAIEHSGSDTITNAAIRGLHRFVTSNADRRALLLGGRAPRRDTTLQLSRSYNATYDEILLRIQQAKDYFLLIGPPGTGKTSMALRFMVEEALSSVHPERKKEETLLLLSYTNRAVDEICSMLVEAGFDFLRLGNEYSCDDRFKPYLLERTIEETPRLDTIRSRIENVHIVVGTTSMVQTRPFLLSLKHFSTAIIDEASQILEPDIIGLLSSDAIDRFILIGDHKQLPAVVQQSEKESCVDDPLLRDICLDDCRHSLFERLIRHERQQCRTEFIGILHHQGRMHPDIAAFPSQMFYAHEQLLPIPCPHQQETTLGYDLLSEDALDDLLKSKRVLFIEKAATDSAPGCQKVDEWQLGASLPPSVKTSAASLLRRIQRFHGTRFDAQKTVGVIVPYRNKIAEIRQEIEKLDIPEIEKVTIDTVERYQGSQRDIIIFDFSVEHRYQLDFLTANRFMEGDRIIDRKLNVAITRARRQLILTGDSRILNTDPVFRQLTDFVKANGGYVWTTSPNTPQKKHH